MYFLKILLIINYFIKQRKKSAQRIFWIGIFKKKTKLILIF